MAQIDVEPVRAHRHARHEQLDDAGLLGWDQRLPEIVELRQRRGHGALVEVGALLLQRAGGARDDLRRAQQPPDLADDR